jgi:hypothetical protein
MQIFDRVKKEFRENKQIRLDGKITAIPWLSLPKLSTVLPGVQQKRYVICTANSKVGKSKMTDFLYVYEPFDFVNTTETHIKLKIFYFSLEMSKEDKIKEVVSYKLFKETGNSISSERLGSVFKDYILEDSVEKIIDTYDDFFQKFESTVTYIDDVRNPYGIYKYVRDYAIKNGTIIYKTVNIDGINQQLEDYYIPNNPNEYVIVIVDHLSLLQPEKGMDLWSAIMKFSSEYCIRLRNRFGYTVVNVQQQSAESDKQVFTLRGDTIVEKLRPSTDGMADCKLTVRDADLVIGLFAPNRYGIKMYSGHDLSKLKDNYRELSILLNRRGSGGQCVDLYFNGATNYFKEI